MDGQRLLDKEKVKHVHLVGIGGIGLSAIARVLHQDGYVVSGCDAQQTALTAELTTLGMDVRHGHHPGHIADVDLVIVSSAVPYGNPELVAARNAGKTVVKRDQVLGELMAAKVGIAVAGTHGKTTTSALISFVLTEMGLDPTFIVGGILRDVNTNARLGQGPHFVVEADEYDHMFLGLRPKLAVVTIIEMDHPDCFSDIGEVMSAFDRFVRLVPNDGAIIGCADGPRVAELLRRLRKDRPVEVITYGLDAESTWHARNVEDNAWGGSDLTVMHHGRAIGQCQLRLAGLHNVSNALAVLAVAHCLGLDMERVLAALPGFHGVCRRFEIKGEANGILVIDDYAHHPTEIRATLAAARRRYGERPLWVFFQPHTYSRTKSLMAEFAKSFGDADHVVISEIYAARETDNLGITARDLVERVTHPDVRYAATLLQASEYLKHALRPGDVLLTLGAGDGYTVAENVLLALGETEAVRLGALERDDS
ncbi:MAG TPA: UDP-N-acetylmuramate--L-alanine ligase [Anaerolineae bacterium]|nr:UDP-N-acetylmuramate--L-alanine ligase [Anaerolineae bacterium]